MCGTAGKRRWILSIAGENWSKQKRNRMQTVFASASRKNKNAFEKPRHARRFLMNFDKLENSEGNFPKGQQKDDEGGLCRFFHSCHTSSYGRRTPCGRIISHQPAAAPAAVHILVSNRPWSLHRPRLASAIDGGGALPLLPPHAAHQHLLLLVTAVPRPSQQGGPGSELGAYETES